MQKVKETYIMTVATIMAFLKTALIGAGISFLLLLLVVIFDILGNQNSFFGISLGNCLWYNLTSAIGAGFYGVLLFYSDDTVEVLGCDKVENVLTVMTIVITMLVGASGFIIMTYLSTEFFEIVIISKTPYIIAGVVGAVMTFVLMLPENYAILRTAHIHPILTIICMTIFLANLSSLVYIVIDLYQNIVMSLFKIIIALIFMCGGGGGPLYYLLDDFGE